MSAMSPIPPVTTTNVNTPPPSKKVLKFLTLLLKNARDLPAGILPPFGPERVRYNQECAKRRNLQTQLSSFSSFKPFFFKKLFPNH